MKSRREFETNKFEKNVEFIFYLKQLSIPETQAYCLLPRCERRVIALA